VKIITVPIIRDWKPCYEPTKVVNEDWSGTLLDVLALDISIEDRFWVVLREELLGPKVLRLFAVRCARKVQHLMTDERSIKALEVAERFAFGEATDEELEAARDAAWATARDAAWATARAAAGEAAWAAARAAAGEAAWAAAWARQLEILRELINEFPEEVRA
jgi:hypothetical protein